MQRRNMFKRFLICVLTVSLITGMTGCKKNKEEAVIEDDNFDFIDNEDDIEYEDDIEDYDYDDDTDEYLEEDYEGVDDDSEELEELFASLADQISYRNQEAPNDYKEIDAGKELPEKVDLREYGYVTPVRNQDPWGTCWTFGICAAAETSILSAKGLSYEEFEEEYGFDLTLSEKHLAYFANRALPEASDDDYKSYNGQDGEGMHFTNDTLNQEMIGGLIYYGATAFAAGIGPNLESEYPYCPNDFDSREEAISEVKNADELTKMDWSIDEEFRVDRCFELVDANFLPTPTTKYSDGRVEYNEKATNIIKSEIANGRGVAVAYYADMALPGQDPDSSYMNIETSAQYVYNPELRTDHDVCIVGYDDNYSKSNFLEGHQPPGDGAFICKNSWGARNASNKYDYGDYGVDGNGFFYLSYYDMSIGEAMSFSFDPQFIRGKDYRVVIDGYDFMPTITRKMNSLYYPEEIQMANVFDATSELEVTSVSMQTMGYNCDVTYTIYLLDDNYLTPVDGEVLTTFSRQYQYPGYHRTELPKPVTIPEGRKYAVVEKIFDHTDDGDVYEIVMNYANNESTVLDSAKNESSRKASKDGTDDEDDEDNDFYEEDVQEESASHREYYKGVIHEGESYLGYKDKWTDQTNLIETIREEYGCTELDFDNFPIKAYINLKK